MFDRASIIEGASLNPAAGVPATIGERAGVDWRTFRETQTSFSDQAALERAYDDAIEEIEAATGQRIFNPVTMTETGQSMEAAEARFASELARLQERHPDARLPAVSPTAIREEIGRQRAALRREQAEITRRSIDPVVSLAGGAATAGAALLDPPVLASMAFGAPWSSGILRGALVDAGIGMASEIPIQARVQAGRRQFGEEASLSEATRAVLTVGAGGLLFSGLLRGGARAVSGTRALLAKSKELRSKAPDVAAAESFLTRKVEAEESSPFPDTPAGRAAHEARLSAAELAIREGRVADLGPADQPAVAGEEISSPGQDPVSEAAAAARQEARDRMEIGAHERAVIEALGPALDDEAALKAVFEDIRRGSRVGASLLRWLARNGGLKDTGGELRHLGVTNKTMPGLLRPKSGMQLDIAAEAAQEAGFFPDRPIGGGDVQPDELLEAIRAELHGEKALRSDDAMIAEDESMVEALADAISRAGIDVHGVRFPEFQRQVQELRRAVAERGRGQEAARMARAGADAVEIEERLALMAEEDEMAFADMQRRYQGREDEVIVIEGEEGKVERMTVAEMMATMEREQNDFEALKVCVGGSRG